LNGRYWTGKWRRYFGEKIKFEDNYLNGEITEKKRYDN